IHRSLERLSVTAASVFGRRASAVRRHGPSADPSAPAGEPSRPDAETASAAGGSRRTRWWAVTCWTTATTAFQTPSPSTSDRPGPGWRDGTASAAWARRAPWGTDAAGLHDHDP